MNRRREPQIRRSHKWKDLATAAAQLLAHGFLSAGQAEGIRQACRRKEKAEAREKDRRQKDH